MPASSRSSPACPTPTEPSSPSTARSRCSHPPPSRRSPVQHPAHPRRRTALAPSRRRIGDSFLHPDQRDSEDDRAAAAARRRAPPRRRSHHGRGRGSMEAGAGAVSACRPHRRRRSIGGRSRGSARLGHLRCPVCRAADRVVLQARAPPVALARTCRRHRRLAGRRGAITPRAVGGTHPIRPQPRRCRQVPPIVGQRQGGQDVTGSGSGSLVLRLPLDSSESLPAESGYACFCTRFDSMPSSQIPTAPCLVSLCRGIVGRCRR